MIYPNKVKHTSFNMTNEASNILTNTSLVCSISKSDLVEALIRNQIGKPPIQAQQFAGKGKTQTVILSDYARTLLEVKSKELEMSMGGYIEALIKEEYAKSQY